MIIASRSREVRKRDQRPLNKKFKDLRVYNYGLPNRALYPYDYQYCVIFKNLLRKNNLMCPVYNHIYIGIAQSIEECLSSFYSIESWHEYGLSVIDYPNYLNQPKAIKDKIVFEALVTGLKDIAHIDGLDQGIIDKTIEHIKLKGIDTELEHSTVENKRYKLTVTYFSQSIEEKHPIYFNLLDKASNKLKRFEIGRVNQFQLYIWLQKITIGKTHIKVKSSTSFTANLWLENLPRSMEFNINELLNG